MTQPDPIARVIEQYAIENANLRITISQLQSQVETLKAQVAQSSESSGDKGEAD